MKSLASRPARGPPVLQKRATKNVRRPVIPQSGRVVFHGPHHSADHSATRIPKRTESESELSDHSLWVPKVPFTILVWASEMDERDHDRGQKPKLQDLSSNRLNAHSRQSGSNSHNESVCFGVFIFASYSVRFLARTSSIVLLLSFLLLLLTTTIAITASNQPLTNPPELLTIATASTPFPSLSQSQ